MSRLTRDHQRSFESRFGTITIGRLRGYCKRCRKWRFPADAALGLEESAGYSPRVQEMAALLASKMPVSEASVVLEHLTGVQLPRATLDRKPADSENGPNESANRKMNKPARASRCNRSWCWNPIK